ncbi:MAG: GHMP kinase [Deltaproteobacteria bacterium]|nr:GHMP kinase [Deltaproteobacteria bacterium]
MSGKPRGRITKIINAVAPCRICDEGGWTDTWFALIGMILNFCIYPFVEVQIVVRECRKRRITLYLENFQSSYDYELGSGYDKNPLIEAALEMVPIPENVHLEISIHSQMPPGASTGSSAALVVALIGALDALTPGRLAAAEVARLAHEVETLKLRQQSGIQDQLAAAFGGINFIEMREFPHGVVSPIKLPDSLWWELERRFCLVYVGKPHNSSKVHEEVIEKLGSHAKNNPHMVALRRIASQAKDALCSGDFRLFGEAMNANTREQEAMHPALVNPQFHNIIDISKEFGCVGAKVNGAGGDGGTVTLLTNGLMPQKRQMEAKLVNAGYQVIPIYLARQGLRVWVQ